MAGGLTPTPLAALVEDMARPAGEFLEGLDDRARAELTSDQRRVAVICPVAPTDIVQMNAPRVVHSAWRDPQGDFGDAIR